jgi:hypothetical protein
MGDLSISTWAARIVGVGLFFLVLFVLFWPILIERHSNLETVNLRTACGDMIAQMRQQSTSGAGFTQAVAHPECWSAQAAR